MIVVLPLRKKHQMKVALKDLPLVLFGFKVILVYTDIPVPLGVLLETVQ